MGCSCLSVVTSIAGAGLLGGVGGLAGGLGGLGGIAGGLGSLAGGLGGLGGIAGSLSSLGSIPGIGDITRSLSGLGAIPGLSGIGDLPGSLGSLGTNLIGDLAESTSGIIGQIQGSMTGVVNSAFSVCGDAVKGALGEVTGSISGAIGGDILSTLSSQGITLPSSDLFSSITQSGAQFMQNGYAGLTECIAITKGFCDSSASLLGSISAAGSQISSFVNLTSTFGQMTGGAVNNLLNPVTALTQSLGQVASGAGSNPLSYIGTLQTSINQSQGVFKSLTGDMTKWGTMFDIASPNDFYSPIKLAENLVQKNVPSFNKLLEDNQINPFQIDSVNPREITQILDSAPPAVVRDVVARTGFKIPITKLSDALDPEIALSDLTRNSFKDFDTVAKQINSVGPTTAQSFGELGTKLSNIEFPQASVLIDLERDASKLRDVLNPNNTARAKLTGTGSGVFGNPTMNDMMGTYTGTPYNIRLAGILQGQRRIAESTTGRAFAAAVAQAKANSSIQIEGGGTTDQADADVIRSAYRAMVNDAENKEIIETMDRFYSDMQASLVREKQNLKAARFDPTDVVGSIHSIYAFLQSLETAHRDDFKVGYREWVESAASDDIYGAAVRAAIVEGKNKAIVQELGLDISPASVIDFTQAEADRLGINADGSVSGAASRCCPPFNERGPAYPTEDALLDTYCDGTSLYGIYADGQGLNYARLIESNSVKCGAVRTTTSTSTTSTTSTTTTTAAPVGSTSTTTTTTTAAPVTGTTSSTTTTSTTTTSTTTTTTTAAPCNLVTGSQFGAHTSTYTQNSSGGGMHLRLSNNGRWNVSGSTLNLATGAWYTGAANGDPALSDTYEFRVTALTLDSQNGPDTEVSINGEMFYVNSTLQSGATLPTAWTSIVLQQVLQLGVGTLQVDMDVSATATIQIRKASDPSCLVSRTVKLILNKGAPV